MLFYQWSLEELFLASSYTYLYIYLLFICIIMSQRRHSSCDAPHTLSQPGDSGLQDPF